MLDLPELPRTAINVYYLVVVYRTSQQHFIHTAPGHRPSTCCDAVTCHKRSPMHQFCHEALGPRPPIHQTCSRMLHAPAHQFCDINKSCCKRTCRFCTLIYTHKLLSFPGQGIMLKLFNPRIAHASVKWDHIQRSRHGPQRT